MSVEALASHDDLARMSGHIPHPASQSTIIEPGSAIFHFPSHRLINCNSRFHRLLEEVGCPMRMSIHWQDILNAPATKELNSNTLSRIEKFAEACVTPTQRHTTPQQYVIQTKQASAGLTRNLFLTLIPLQHHGADWALVMWILEYLHEPTPMPSPKAPSAPPVPSAAPQPAEHSPAKRVDPRKSLDELQTLADKAEKKRKEKPWVAATMKWNMKVKKSSGGKAEPNI